MLRWVYKGFSDLSLEELYALMRLRQEVFVVEQNCVYLDADGKDFEAFHLLGYGEGDVLLAYARILPPGISYEEVALGRIVTSQQARGEGLGKALMEEQLIRVREQFGAVPIRISAQCYLDRFYKGFGFVPVGEPYLEDGIPHQQMFRAGDAYLAS